MKKWITIAAVAAMVALMALPSQAASSADTTATFTIAGGTLDVSAPASQAFGAGTPGTPLTKVWTSPVVINDSRNVSPSGWTLTAASTAFSNNGNLVPASAVIEAVGNTPTTTGAGCTYTASSGTAGLNTPQVLATAAGCAGSNTWSALPLTQIAIPAGVFAGTYTGVITHAVSG